MSGTSKAIAGRAKLCGILGEAHGMLLREVTKLRREHRRLSETTRTTAARLAHLREQVAFQRARRDWIMGKKRGPA